MQYSNVAFSKKIVGGKMNMRGQFFKATRKWQLKFLCNLKFTSYVTSLFPGRHLQLIRFNFIFFSYLIQKKYNQRLHVCSLVTSPCNGEKKVIFRHLKHWFITGPSLTTLLSIWWALHLLRDWLVLQIYLKALRKSLNIPAWMPSGTRLINKWMKQADSIPILLLAKQT